MPDEASALFMAPSRPMYHREETAQDTATAVSKIPVAFDTTHCRETDAPTDRMAAYTTGRPGYAVGMIPVPRPTLPGHDTGVLALLMALFLLLTLNCRHYTTFLKTFAQDLLKVRERDNAFDDHTVSESRIIVSLVISLCMCEGVLVNAAFPWITLLPDPTLFTRIVILCGVAAGYYIWQFVAYATVGYLFTQPGLSSQWMRGFNASQALLGLCLVIPTLGVLFRPEIAEVSLMLAVLLYIAARIIFICKGFKIFYHNYFSLIYFILYLCTLEIVPLLLLYRAARIISQF